MSEPDSTDRIIIPFELACKLIEQMAPRYLRQCPCRTEMQLCPRDNWDICILFEDAPVESLRSARPIKPSQAVQVLLAAHQRGEIHNLFFTRTTHKLTELCTCCGCCCEPIRELNKNGDYHAQLRTDYVVMTDAMLCTACGACLDNCFFSARQLNDGIVHLIDERCFGCGKCIESCPQNAISMQSQSGRGVQLPFLNL
jgi:Na+-translocating ferredoxin:NAD+ oxidoreductase subunit B